MPKERTLEGILEELCHNTMGNPPYRIDQAKSAIRQLLLGEIERARVFTLNQGGKYLEQAEIKKIVSEL